MKSLLTKFRTITIQGHNYTVGDRFGIRSDDRERFRITHIIDDKNVYYESDSVVRYENTKVEEFVTIYPANEE